MPTTVLPMKHAHHLPRLLAGDLRMWWRGYTRVAPRFACNGVPIQRGRTHTAHPTLPRRLREWYWRFRGFRLLTFEALVTRANGDTEIYQQRTPVKPTNAEFR